MTDSFLRLPKVKQLTGFGRSQIYHLNRVSSRNKSTLAQNL